VTRRLPNKACEHCGENFHPYRSTLRFCSNTCSSRAQYRGHSREALCATCGKPFISRNKDNGKERHWTKCCSRECAGKIHYKGGQSASARRRRYGLEPADYDRLLRAQGGGCLLCGAKPHYPLYVDHHHDSGRVRGLLCARCNTAVGYLETTTWEDILRYRDYAMS